MKRPVAKLAVTLALGIGACGEPVGPPEASAPGGWISLAPRRLNGTGLIVESLTGVSLPIVGPVVGILIDQAVITDLMLVEDVTGAIIGLEATGTVTGTLTATGVRVLEEEFTSTFGITSSGPGQCDVVTIDLGPLRLDALNLVTTDVPIADVTVRGSGAVGSLLCNLGSLLSGAVGGVTSGVRGLVNAINRLI
jgi:hypothetical protein